MNQREEIRIAKKYFTILYPFQNTYTPGKSGVVVRFPARSQYKGYKFYAAEFSCFPRYLGISKSKYEGHLFALEKVDGESRENSPRPKLSFEEIQAEFAQHSKQFYVEDLPQALAYVKPCYKTKQQSEFGYYCVGGYNDKYFYENGIEWRARYRLNTPAVRILKPLLPEEVASVKEKAQRFKFLNELILYDFAWLYLDIKYSEDKMKNRFPDICDAVEQKLEELRMILDKKSDACRREFKELEEYFKVLAQPSPNDND